MSDSNAIIDYCEEKIKALHASYPTLKDDYDKIVNLARQATYKDVIAYAKTGKSA